MTKLFIPIVFIIVSSIIQSCRKDDQVCYDYKEIKDTNHLVNINSLKTVPEMLDTLAKHPELRVTSILNDEYQTAMFCDYFYKGLLCFDASYSLHKGKKTNGLYCTNNTPKKINVNIIPKLTYHQAIEIAKQNLNFKNVCLAYRLGIRYQDTTSLETSTSYKLVWKIQDTYGNSYVILDANNGEIYSKFDGIWH